MARAIHGVQLLILGGAGIGAFYAAAHLASRASTDPDAVVAPAERVQRPAPVPNLAGGGLPVPSRVSSDAAPAPRPAASAGPLGDRSEAIPGETGQPFASLSWVAPPPPPPKPLVVVAAPPAAPVAPPLPFAFVGLVEKGTPKPQAFLSRGEELLVVALGDTLDNGTYRVDALDAAQIAFMHLPTKTRQVINLSGGSQ